MEDYNPKTFSMKTALNEYLRSKPPKVIDHISPSQLGGCHRSHYYQIKHIAPMMELTLGALSNFEVGFAWEEIIARALTAQNIPFVYQHEMYDPELNVKGTLDFLIGTTKATMGMDKDKLLRVLDSKTQRSEWFWYRELSKKQHRFDRWESDYGYIIQQATYLLLLKKQGFTAVMDAILGYISKDDGIVGDEYSVVLNPKTEREVMQRIDEMNYYLEHDEVPPCTCEGWKTGYCNYGNPNTMAPNKKKKLLYTECCAEPVQLEEWRKEYQAHVVTE